MKKVYGLITLLVVAGMIIGTFLIFNPINANQILSNSYINFEFINNENSNLISNKKADNSYNFYTIKVYTTGSKTLSGGTFSVSSNIKGNSEKIDNYSYKYTFYIENGYSFFIEFSCDNYLEKKQVFMATSYATSLDLKPKNLIDRDNNSYLLEMNGNHSVLYLTNQAYYEEAIMDKYPSKIEYTLKVNDGANVDFTASVQNDNILKIDCESNTITPLAIGKTKITFSAIDGSNFVKNFYFEVKKPTPKQVNNLPSEIEIDMTEKSTYEIKNFTVLPNYTSINDLIFSITSTHFTINNFIITATSVGSGKIFVKVGETTLAEITVNITRTLNPEFSITLDSTKNDSIFIDFNESNLTANASLSDFSNGRVNIVFLINIINTNFVSGNKFSVSYTDSNNIILQKNTLLNEEGISVIINKIGTVNIEIKNENLEIQKILTIIINE